MNSKEIARRGVFSDPERLAECLRYYQALVATLNTTHDSNGEQDALALFEAIAMLLGQLTGGHADAQAAGILRYIEERAQHHRPAFAESGKVARYYTEGLQ